MKILLTNNHLTNRAGSELYTLELADVLRETGHQVAIFTFACGLICDLAKQRQISIFGTEDVKAIETFSPDVIEVHHAPCLYFLGGLKLSSAVVFSSLGLIPLERAPVVWPGVGAAVAVSEEVRDQMLTSPFGKKVRIEIFRNWFDDRRVGRSSCSQSLPGNRKRWLVVSNHLHDPLIQALEQIRAKCQGFTWTHHGLPGNSVEITAKLLTSYDGVITIGRTVLLAAAVGKPCLVYDVHGCDGLLNATNFQSLASRNFSGRVHKAIPSAEQLQAMLLEQPTNIGAVNTIAWEQYRLTARKDEALQRFRNVIDSGIKLTNAGCSAYVQHRR